MIVAFDLDDTLYSERDFVASGREAVRRYLSASGLTHQYDIDGVWTPQMLAVYREHKPEISLTDDAVSALSYLQAIGIKMAIITDGRKVSQTNKYYALGLERFVDPTDLIISEAVGGDKMSGIPFQELMRRHQTECEYIYIGDNPAKDFYEPNKLGWQTVMLLDNSGQNIHHQEMPLDIYYHPKCQIYSLFQYIISNFTLNN